MIRAFLIDWSFMATFSAKGFMVRVLDCSRRYWQVTRFYWQNNNNSDFFLQIIECKPYCQTDSDWHLFPCTWRDVRHEQALFKAADHEHELLSVSPSFVYDLILPVLKHVPLGIERNHTLRQKCSAAFAIYQLAFPTVRTYKSEQTLEPLALQCIIMFLT